MSNDHLVDSFNVTLRYSLPGRSHPNWDEIKDPINNIVGKFPWMNVSYSNPGSQWFKELYVVISGEFDFPQSPSGNVAKKLYSVLGDIYSVAAPFDINGYMYNAKESFNEESCEVYKIFKGNDKAIRGDWDTGFNRVYNPARLMSFAWVIQKDGQYMCNFSL